MTKKQDSVGLVETSYYTFAKPPHKMVLQSGEKLGPITLAYETYGQLSGDKSNAILLLHALSGDAHAAGYYPGDTTPGWWDSMIGPGRAFDTDRYFIICSNVLGGCKGTTGPSSINPETRKPYGLDFPLITIRDMVEAQRHLIDHLGIDRLLAVAGGSMGGTQVLQWLATYPQRIRSAIPIATTMRHSPQQIAFNEVGRQAVMADPNWKDGDYYGGRQPSNGLAVARMVGHITYMSDVSMSEKFGRRRNGDAPFQKFGAGFEIEEYLRARGDSFVKRFDANSYLYITKALDQFDLFGGNDPEKYLRGLATRFLIIAFKSDWLYPAYQSQAISRLCKLFGLDVTYCEIDSTYGHDAFLLEVEEETHLIKHFLKRISKNKEAAGEYRA